jgi:hypothetical protein
MGSGGYAIPSICEPEVIKFDPAKCTAKFILHVEKGTVWQRFNEDRFWEKHNCILTHGSGQPPRGVRRMLFRLHNELKLPLYCVLDNDPWGYYIYSVIKQGSINLAFESQRMAIPEAKYLGLRSIDFERCQLSDSVKISLNDETDDFAHGGEYAAYLNAANYTDGFIGQLWNYIQSEPQYKDKTTLIIAVDHGRGVTSEEWKHHGTKIEHADEIWLAVMGPDTPATGEAKTDSQYYQNQIAKTLAAFLALDFGRDSKVGDKLTAGIST